MANSSGGEFGGFFARFFAFFCDQLIAGALYYLVLALMLKAGFFSVGAIVLLAFLVPAVYYAAMQSSSGQATIGKSLLGLKVATVNGDRASFLRNFGRELAKIISAIPLMIGYLMAAFTGRKQALHDMVASTVVLDVGPAKVVKGAVVVVVAFIAQGAIAAFMLQDVYNKLMQEAMGGMMAEMQGMPGGGMPTGMGMPQQRAPTTPVAPKVVVVTSTPAAPRPAPEAPKAVATPAPQAAAIPVAAAPVAAAPRSAPVVAPKPAAEEPPAAAAPLPAGMPARIASAATPAATPSAAAPAPSAASAPAPLVRPGVPGPKYNDLMSAVLSKDAEAVNELLTFGKWADKADSRGVTPLMIAVRNGDAGSAEALLKAGADPNRNAQGGESAVKIAAARRDTAMAALLERYAKK